MQFRSARRQGWGVAGYQADASEDGDNSAWGNLFDERGKGRQLMQPTDEGWQRAKNVVRHGDWNQYEIVAHGQHVALRLNGIKTISKDVDRTGSGVIAIQIHRGPPMEVQVRSIRLKVLR
jgi:hypothetical protein